MFQTDIVVEDIEEEDDEDGSTEADIQEDAETGVFMML